MKRHIISLSALLAGLALPAGAVHADRIGTATAVIPDSKARPTGGGDRVLTIGASMTRNERVTTDAAGRTQILFVDGSAINIGPSSSLSLDTFVFDSRNDTGALAVTLGKGAMRFIGGKISKSETVTIATPVGTVGIRGGVAQIEYSSERGLTARFLYGDFLSVSTGGQTSMTTRVGTAIDLRAGTPPSAPRPLTSSEVAQSTAQTTGATTRMPSAGAGSTAASASITSAPAPKAADATIAATAAQIITSASPTSPTAVGVTSFGSGLQGGIAAGPTTTGALPSAPVAPVVPPQPILPPRRGP